MNFRLITASLLATLLAVPAFSQNPQTLIKENPERISGIHHRYEAPGKITDTKAPSGYKPFYISHYGRHGSRYMTTTSNMDKVLSVMDTIAACGLFTDEGESMYRDFQALRKAHEGMSGYLTQKGAAEHRGIASRLMKRVPAIFKQKDRREIVAASSTIQRCILSMAAFTGEIRSEWPELDVKLFSGERYMNYILHESSQKKDAALHKHILDSTLFARFSPERALKSWFTEPEAAAELFENYDAAHLCSAIFYEACITQCLDEELPSVLNYFTEDELFNLWYVDNMKLINNEGFTVENGSNRKETASYILNDIIEKADDAIVGNGRAADFRFGHDSGLMPLLALIGIDGFEVRSIRGVSEPGGVFVFEMIPMGSSLQMIFYRNRKNDILVKFIHNERETSIPGLTPVSGPYYKWSEIRNHLVSKL